MFDIDKLFIARYNFKLSRDKITKAKSVEKAEINKALVNFSDWKNELFAINNGKYIYNSDRSNKTTDLMNMYFEENEMPYRWNTDKAEYEKVEGEHSTFIPKYNDDKSASDQGRAAVENRLLDCLLSVITNPLNIAETRVPLDVSTDNVKYFLKYIDKVAKDSNTNSIKYLTPKFQSDTRKSLIGGKKGIGPFALSAAHHTLAQFVNLRFSPKIKASLSKYGITGINSRVDKQFIAILDWLSAMINAHVDTAKDPYIIRMNIVPYTYNMTTFLLRSGFGGKTFLFLPQPILKDMSVAAAKVTGYLDVDNNVSEFKRIEDATKEVLESYQKKAESLATSEERNRLNKLILNQSTKEYRNVSNEDWLKKSLNKTNTFGWYYDQILIAKAFEELSTYAKALSELTTLSQIDTKKFGNNFSMYNQFLNRIKRFLTTQKTFENPQEIFSNTFLMEKAINGIEKPINIMKDKLLRTSDKFSYYRQLVLDLTGNTTTTDEVIIRNLNRYFETSIKNKFFKDKISKEKASELLFGETSIPSRLRQLKTDILAGKYPKLLSSEGSIHNALLETIDKAYKYDNVDLQLPDFIKFTVNKSMDDADTQLIVSWEELLDLGNDPNYTEVGEFARDLVLYAYLTSGDNFGPNTLFAYVPNSYRESMGYVEYMRNAELSGEFVGENMNNALRHLWFDNNLVPDAGYSTTTWDVIDGELAPITSTLPSITVKDTSKRAIEIDGVKYGYPVMFTNTKAIAQEDIVTETGLPLFPLFVKHKIAKSSDPRATMLYRLIGLQVQDVKTNLKGDVEIDYKPVYRITNKLGIRYKGNILVDVDSDSILPQNHPFGWNMDNQTILNNTAANDPYLNRLKGLDEDGEPLELDSRIGKLIPYDSFKIKNDLLYNMPLEEVIKSLSDKGNLSVGYNSTSDVINIYYGADENSELSNFAHRPFEQRKFDYTGNPYGDVYSKTFVKEDPNQLSFNFEEVEKEVDSYFDNQESSTEQVNPEFFSAVGEPSKSTSAAMNELTSKLGKITNIRELTNEEKEAENAIGSDVVIEFENGTSLEMALVTGSIALNGENALAFFKALGRTKDNPFNKGEEVIDYKNTSPIFFAASRLAYEYFVKNPSKLRQITFGENQLVTLNKELRGGNYDSSKDAIAKATKTPFINKELNELNNLGEQRINECK